MSDSYTWYIIEGINPEPWAASEGAIGRKNGKSFIHFHKLQQLRLYQESIKDAFLDQNPQAVKVTGDIELVFYFWRELVQIDIQEGSKSRSNRADATNLQKALEDALQEILYENDRDIRSIRSVLVEQSPETEPAILVCVGTYNDQDELKAIRAVRENLRAPNTDAPDNIRDFDVGDVF